MAVLMKPSLENIAALYQAVPDGQVISRSFFIKFEKIFAASITTSVLKSPEVFS
jgi:hypothetical protein